MGKKEGGKIKNGKIQSKNLNEKKFKEKGTSPGMGGERVLQQSSRGL